MPFAPCVKKSSVSHIFANTKPNVNLLFKKTEVIEGMAKSLLAMLSYQEWVSLALARTLKDSDQLCGNTQSLLKSLGLFTGHQTHMAARLLANCTLWRKDAFLRGSRPTLDPSI